MGQGQIHFSARFTGLGPLSMVIPPAFPLTEADRLRQLACRGTFEAHLTVRADGPEQGEAFARLCAELGAKCVLIELARGENRSQPMTASFHRGELPAVLAEVEALHARLWQGGFPVVRVKLEAVATNPGVPATDDEAARLPGGYFEFHAKLRLPADADLEPLCRVCDRHGAHLSHNDRKRREDGAERFVTLRVYGAGRDRATQAYEALLRDVTGAGFVVVGQQREFTLYDGRADLDAGWLGAPGGEGGS
jgi:hypothetical protein